MAGHAAPRTTPEQAGRRSAPQPGSAQHPEHDWSLRVTLVFRRAGERWEIVHRYADPLVRPIPFEHVCWLTRWARRGRSATMGAFGNDVSEGRMSAGSGVQQGDVQPGPLAGVGRRRVGRPDRGRGAGSGRLAGRGANRYPGRVPAGVDARHACAGATAPTPRRASTGQYLARSRRGRTRPTARGRSSLPEWGCFRGPCAGIVVHMERRTPQQAALNPRCRPRTRGASAAQTESHGVSEDLIF